MEARFFQRKETQRKTQRRKERSRETATGGSPIRKHGVKPAKSQSSRETAAEGLAGVNPRYAERLILQDQYQANSLVVFHRFLTLLDKIHFHLSHNEVYFGYQLL